jgi:hypothetical protein
MTMIPCTLLEQNRTIALLALFLRFATTVHSAAGGAQEEEFNDTTVLTTSYDNKTTVPPYYSEEYVVVESKATTVLLTFSLLLLFAIMGVNMRQKSFRRTENLSRYRRGTYEVVSLLELPPGGNSNAMTNYDSASEEEEKPAESSPEAL